uniref:Signal peptidase I n=1 Tax=Heterorhabditis bacteriophora TaxID=37862 RepID=A0A1I7WWT6_HETBA
MNLQYFLIKFYVACISHFRIFFSFIFIYLVAVGFYKSIFRSLVCVDPLNTWRWMIMKSLLRNMSNVMMTRLKTVIKGWSQSNFLFLKTDSKTIVQKIYELFDCGTLKVILIKRCACFIFLSFRPFSGDTDYRTVLFRKIITLRWLILLPFFFFVFGEQFVNVKFNFDFRMRGIAMYTTNKDDPYVTEHVNNEYEIKPDDNIVAVAKIHKVGHQIYVILDVVCRYSSDESRLITWIIAVKRKKRDASQQGHTDAVISLAWNKNTTHVLSSLQYLGPNQLKLLLV